MARIRINNEPIWDVGCSGDFGNDLAQKLTPIPNFFLMEFFKEERAKVILGGLEGSAPICIAHDKVNCKECGEKWLKEWPGKIAEMNRIVHANKVAEVMKGGFSEQQAEWIVENLLTT